MKTTNFLLLISLFFLMSCSKTNYLEDYNYVHVSRYGGKFTASIEGASSIKGELLAVNDTFAYVLNISGLNKSNIHVVERKAIKKYLIQVANPESAGSGYGLLPLVSLSHGVFMGFTLPLNALTGLSLYNNERMEFTFKSDNLKWEELKKFSRFPQGLPSDKNLKDLLLRSYPVPITKDNMMFNESN